MHGMIRVRVWYRPDTERQAKNNANKDRVDMLEAVKVGCFASK